MKWSVHPAKYNYAKTVLSLIFIFGFLVYVSIFFALVFGILGFIILFFSLHSYYFPTHYEITEEKVIIKNIFTTQRRKLKEFKKVYRGKNGVLLSPFKRKTFLNQFRGVFLLLPPNRDEIVDYLKECIRFQEEALEDSSEKNI